MDVFSPSTGSVIIFVGLGIVLFGLIGIFMTSRQARQPVAVLARPRPEAELRFSCRPFGKGDFRFELENVADQEARNVSLNVVDGRDMFPETGLRELFPLPRLGPREKVTVPSGIKDPAAGRARVMLSWDDDYAAGRSVQFIVRIC